MKRVIFCDFDGTVTATETFSDMLHHFSPELSAELVPKMHSLELSIQQGVRRILETIPSARFDEVLDFVRGTEVREGLDALLDYADAKGVPVVLVSGGMVEMIRVVLGSTLERFAELVAIEVDTSGPYLRPHSRFEGDGEMVSKVQVMRQHAADERVCIGDSVSDLNIAQQAELVFARDRLAAYLKERQVAFCAWDDFFDIRRQLEQRWGAP